jgi:hypothetical protein
MQYTWQASSKAGDWAPTSIVVNINTTIRMIPEWIQVTYEWNVLLFRTNCYSVLQKDISEGNDEHTITTEVPRITLPS